MNHRPIVFDMDGVMADYVTGFRNLVHARLGLRRFGTDEQQDWFTVYNDLTEPQLADALESIAQDRNFWRYLPPLVTKDELEAIRQLQEKYPVVFITNRTGVTAAAQTVGWLEMNKIIKPSVLVVPTSSAKAPIIAALDALASLEDNHDNVVAIAAAAPNTAHFIIDRKYNAHLQHEQVTRVTRVAEYLEALKGLIP